VPTAFHIPEKLFFRIGEVASLLGLQPHVLRYWEGEFELLKPRKTTTNQRRYTRGDVCRIAVVRHLLHHRRYSIAGARRMLKAMDLSDEDVERQLDLLEGIDDKPAAAGEPPPKARGSADGNGGALHGAHTAGAPAGDGGEGGSFLAEREKILSELSRLRGQCALLVDDNARLSRELDDTRAGLAELHSTAGDGVRGLLRLLDSADQEG
jgi:DNA-binding transcriptional MerR regulator